MSITPPSNSRVIIFIVILSFVCALILAILASALRKPQEIAQELDRSKQMMIAARIVNPSGYFQVKKGNQYVPAKLEKGARLVPAENGQYPDRDELFEVYQKRIRPMLVDHQGNLLTFKKADINEREYINNNRKRGYYTLPLMLVYEVLPNPSEEKEKDEKPINYVIPVNGYGLWDAIYAFLAIDANGDTVIGTAWYDQKETPGLGAVISEPKWQAQFHGKDIFLPNPDGKTDFKTAPLGLTVVKGEVKNVIGDKPKAKTAVDGIPGATLTGTGVTKAYHDSLAPYRPFFIKLHQQNEGK